MHISGQSIVRQQKRSLTNRRQRSVVPAPIALRTDSHLLENDAVLALRRGLPARAGTGVAGARLRAGLRPRSPDNPGTIPSGRRALFLTAAGHLLELWRWRSVSARILRQRWLETCRTRPESSRL